MNSKRKFLLTLVSTAILVGCAPTTSPLIDDSLQQKAEEVEVLLNLTSIGLYNGAKGKPNSDHFLENTVTLSLEVGAYLPTANNITATSKDVEFKTWVYYSKGGILSSTEKVVEGIFEYQAHFEYKGTFENDDNGGNGGGIDTNKVYFITQTWWQKDGATTSIHYWGNDNTSWPGKVMHLEETLSNNRQVWSYEININHLTGFMFARTSSGTSEGSTGTDWGAKTQDLNASMLGSNNCIVMTNSSEQWGNPGVDVKFTTYVPGRIDY
jgi:hypothetical protein